MSSIFVSYSHADEQVRQRLHKHLAVLLRSGEIDVFHDRRIEPGEHFDDVIDSHLSKANIVLLLVTADFLASPYCYEREFQTALAREQRGECRIIPIIVKDCDWQRTPMGKLLALPTDGKPIVRWSHEDSAYMDIVAGIRRALSERSVDRGAGKVISNSSAPPASSYSSRPRSANLSVRRKFGDEDKDRFLAETFDFLGQYFENSLADLSNRNPGISGNVLRVDALTFLARGYREGKIVARCRVFRGGWLGGICYSHNDASDNSSFNESISVVDDDGQLGLKSIGIAAHVGRRSEGILSQEGAAEVFWSLFVAPFQRG